MPLLDRTRVRPDVAKAIGANLHSGGKFRALRCLIPKVIENDAFHESGSGRPGGCGVQRDACIGQAPQRPRRPDTPHTQGRAILAASRVERCLLYAHNGAARALLAAKIASVKCVIIKDLWYHFAALPSVQ